MKESLAIPDHAPGMAFLQCLPGYLHPRHRHDELEMNLVLRGRATCLVGNRLYRIERGSLLWLFPEQEHNVLDKSEDYTVWIAYWRPSAIKRACTDDPSMSTCLTGDPSGWLCRRLNEPQIKRLDLPLRHAAQSDHIALSRNALTYVLALAWNLSSDGSAVLPMTSLHPSVERAARLICDPEQRSLSQLGKACGLSPARLSSLFSKQMGIPLAAYRSQQRIDRFLAEHDPRSTNLTASALNAGFGSYSQFHRVFTAYMKMSPQQWVRREREQPITLDRRPSGRRV
jgi:AraC-like DNA-binding protein